MDAQEILKNLEKDLKYYNDSIKEVAYEVLSSKISKYPIFIAHQHEVKIGEVILNKDDFEKNWTINATTVEEL
ncbi:MAG: hypothetical protein U9R42_03120, partial [Bacteroidota bacterium]|nr:hypothetical protein [Bacteroidota bacterium]